MANIVEFVMKLTDLMSVPFSKITNKSVGLQKTLTEVQKSNSKLQATFGKTGSSVDALRRKVDRLTAHRDLLPSSSETQIRRINKELKQTNKEINRLQTINGKGLFATLKSGVKSLPGFGFATNPVTMAVAGGAGIGKLMGMGMENQKIKTSMQVLGGDKAGAKLHGDLFKFAQDSIFGNEVFKDAQTMLAFGGSVKDVMPDLKMLGDISMGDKNRLQSLTLAFSQIQSTGRLMGQDLLQLVNAGFNPLQVISQKTGIGMAELKKKMEAGAISFDMVKKAFQDATGPGGKFFDMTNKIAQTPFGKWEALKGQIQGIGVSIGTALLPLASGLLNAATTGLNLLAGAAKWVYGEMKILWVWIQNNKTVLMSLLTGISAGFIVYKIWQGWQVLTYLWMMRSSVAQVIYANATKLATLATTLFTNGLKLLRLAFVSTPIGWVVLVIGLLVTAITYAWQHSEKFREIVMKVWRALKQFGTLIKDLVIGRIKEIISGLGGLGKALYLLFTGQFREAVEAGKNALIDLSGVNTARQAYEGAKKIGEGWSESVASGITQQQQLIEIAKMKALKGSPIKDMIASTFKGFDTGKDWMLNIAKKYAASKKAGNGKVPPDAGHGVSSGITSGGPRTITINVNKEMIGKLAINSYNVKEGVGEMENLIEEGLRRILYSAEAS